MAESEIATSVALYRYLCRFIVGTEEYVKIIRLIVTVRDKVDSDKHRTQITSGSFGEGLKMKGSDIDIMFVLRDIHVYETITDYPGTSFIMETRETRPGFTLLRLNQTTDPLHYSWCVQHFRNSNLYLSNVNIKKSFCIKDVQSIHGPCISDKDQISDFAYCVHGKFWISQARQWFTRSTNSWPNESVKQTILDDGVLFVPVGVKGSQNEEVEWRISFSVGEKFLVYTFSHTQIMCYALMKILLKDVIEANNDCKDLLCSYFLKTILFWVSEEISVSQWSPINLLRCFMRCFSRLVYCVKYALCPHYFIPENDLFEHKIKGTDRKTLLENLTILHSYGWRCILFSKQFSRFNVESLRKDTGEKINSVIELMKVLNDFDVSSTNRNKKNNKINSFQSIINIEILWHSCFVKCC